MARETGLTLPAKPNVGDRFALSVVGGLTWHLEYDDEGEYPWKRVG